MPSFKSFDDTEIFYDFKEGKKPFTLIILHGWLANSAYYEMLYPYFEDFNIINWNARCHGKSQADPSANIDKLSKDLNFFLNNIYSSNNPVIAMGHSMGALTLMNYVIHFSCDKINKLIFIDQSPKLKTDQNWKLGIYGNYTDETQEKMLKAFEEDLGEGVIKLTASGLNTRYNQFIQRNFQKVIETRQTFSEKEKKGCINIWKSLIETDFRPSLDLIDIPTLLLYGERSQFYLKETGEYMHKHIKNSQLVYLEKGDHSPFVQEPLKFKEAIKQFIVG